MSEYKAVLTISSEALANALRLPSTTRIVAGSFDINTADIKILIEDEQLLRHVGSNEHYPDISYSVNSTAITHLEFNKFHYYDLEENLELNLIKREND